MSSVLRLEPAGARSLGTPARTAFRSVREDLARAAELMSTAYADMGSSLRALEQNAQSTAEVYHRLASTLADASDGDGEGNSASFQELTTAVLQGFVDEIISIARDAVTVADELEAAMAEMGRVVKLVDRVNRGSLATKLVSLNASVQAAQSGDDSGNDGWQKVFRIFANAVRELSESAQVTSDEISEAALKTRSELNKMKQTVERMAARDMAEALDSKRRVEAIVQHLGDANRAVEEMATEARAQVAVAVQALQFDDIITQLMGGIDEKLVALEEVLIKVLESAHLPPDLVGSLLADLEALGSLTNHVTQQDTDAGDIELF
ncbi:MAG: hypothetical protein AAGF12_30485 [Myxococcota bacterium]